jgi:hypothetical protein
MTPKKLGLAAALLSPVLLIGASYAASAHSGTAEEQAACTPDVLSLCLFEIPNEDRIVKCLNRNVGRLSPACRDVIAGPDIKAKPQTKH